MKAAVHTRYGPPDVVRIREVDEPAIEDHDVLVRVQAATVNRTDCGFRAAKPWIVRFFSGLAKPRATILGSEFAGVVEAVGEASPPSGPATGSSGSARTGSARTRSTCRCPRTVRIATMPANMTFEEVAPSTEGSHYALSGIRKAGIRRGHSVLVNGATGAIGSAAVQLLKGLGATVTAVCDTATMELVRGLGADRVIDRTTQDFTKDGQTYDMVLDAVGKSSFGRCKRSLKPRGIYISSDLGPWSQNPILALITPLFRGRKVMFPIPPKHSQREVRYIKEMIESGAFRPVIDRRYRLDQIVEAYLYVETGQKIGSVVIEIVPSG